MDQKGTKGRVNEGRKVYQSGQAIYSRGRVNWVYNCFAYLARVGLGVDAHLLGHLHTVRLLDEPRYNKIKISCSVPVFIQGQIHTEYSYSTHCLQCTWGTITRLHGRQVYSVPGYEDMFTVYLGTRKI